jgi:peptidoglycan-associated lipoprotein
MTSRLTPVLALAALGFGVGCSHAQPVTRAQRPASTTRLAARPPTPAPAPVARVEAEPAATKGDDAIFFDFDSALLRDDARPVLLSVAQLQRQRPGSVRVEGNCDEVGTTEYNLALGEQRARAAKDYLERLGVPSKEIATISYGAQRPRYSGHDDAARAKNRRDDLIMR